MSGYVYAWITVAVLAALAEMLLPGGKGCKTAGHVRFLAGICMITALIPAVKEGTEWLGDFADDPKGWLDGMDAAAGAYSACFDEQLLSITEEAWKSSVYKLLKDEFSVSAEDCLVSVTVVKGEDGSFALTDMTVRLSGKAVLVSLRQVRSLIEDRLAVTCNVTADIPMP